MVEPGASNAAAVLQSIDLAGGSDFVRACNVPYQLRI